MSLEAFVDGEWNEVSDDYLLFPGDVMKTDEWRNQFMKMNDLRPLNAIGMEDMEDVIIYGYKNLACDADYPYVVEFDYLGEGRFILCADWKDVMMFLTQYCLICKRFD